MDSNVRYYEVGPENGDTPQGGGKKKNGRKGIIIFLIIAAAVIVVAFAASHYTNTARVRNGSVTVSTNEKMDIGSDYIGELPVEGEIVSSGGSGQCDQNWMITRIQEMQADSHNKGILLNINSPGGDSYATAKIYKALKEYKESTGRPVYAYMGSEAASGGYYIPMAADKIYADELCWTGSIGVRTGYIYDVSGLLKKLGVRTTIISSGKNKTMGDPTKKLTKEQRKIIQDLIDEIYDDFVDVVAEGRGMSKSRVKKLADGRIYSAKQAKRLGLIDEIADYQDAVAEMKRECGFGSTPVIKINMDSGSTLLSSLISSMASGKSASELEQVNQLLSGTN
ncbi:MAG: signal peptide peptidase SppA, partial [Anaerovoracaceae bacterium]